jgi:hypothetical protein
MKFKKVTVIICTPIALYFTALLIRFAIHPELLTTQPEPATFSSRTITPKPIATEPKPINPQVKVSEPNLGETPEAINPLKAQVKMSEADLEETPGYQEFATRKSLEIQSNLPNIEYNRAQMAEIMKQTIRQLCPHNDWEYQKCTLAVVGSFDWTEAN